MSLQTQCSVLAIDTQHAAVLFCYSSVPWPDAIWVQHHLFACFLIPVEEARWRSFSVNMDRTWLRGEKMIWMRNVSGAAFDIRERWMQLVISLLVSVKVLCLWLFILYVLFYSSNIEPFYRAGFLNQGTARSPQVFCRDLTLNCRQMIGRLHTHISLTCRVVRGSNKCLCYSLPTPPSLLFIPGACMWHHMEWLGTVHHHRTL